MNMTSFIVEDGNSNYSTVDNVLFNADKTTLLLCPCTKSGDYEIPNSVIEIAENAFHGCDKLSSVKMPNSVHKIGVESFGSCENLLSVNIPNSVTEIGVGAFMYCKKLSSITIPNSITSIGKETFYKCSNLAVVTIPKSVTSIGSSAFSYCDNLQTVLLYNCTPPSISNLSFDDRAGLSIYVPKAAVDTYMSAPYWDELNIQGLTSTALADGESYNFEEDYEEMDISYTRTFNNTSWQALYVPFSMSYNDWKDNFDIAYINGIRQQDTDGDGVIDYQAMDVVKITNGALKPNTPYMIKAKTTGEKTITVNDATLYAASENSIDCSTTVAKYTFTGIYSTIESATMLSNNYWAMGGGTLRPCNSDLKPYRWYMSIESRDPMVVLPSGSNARININVIGEEDETTGIKTIYDDVNGNVECYDILGRKVSDSYKGLNIKNGKKYYNNNK